MTRYERVTFRDTDGRARTVILRDPRRTTTCGVEVVGGVEVNRDGDEVRRGAADACYRIIQASLVTRAVPMRMDLHYATLVADTQEAIDRIARGSLADAGRYA